MYKTLAGKHFTSESTNKFIYCKICLLGNKNVGKTTLFERFLDEGFTALHFCPSIIIAVEKIIAFKSHILRTQIWYIPYSSSRAPDGFYNLLYAYAHGAIILYDVSDTELESYNDCTHWAQELWEHNSNRRVPIIVIGNKKDLRQEPTHTIPYDEGKELAEKLSQEAGMEVPFIEVSAKTGENVKKVLEILPELVIKFLESKIPEKKIPEKKSPGISRMFKPFTKMSKKLH